MIYDQFQRLHPDTLMFSEAGQPEVMSSQPARSKPITSLLLVNKRIGSEYRDSCKKRLGWIVSSFMENLVRGGEYEEEIHSWFAERASFIHMHAGNWMNRHWIDDPEWTLSPLRGWLAHQQSQMPNLDSITISIYLRLGSIEKAEERKKLEEALEDFVSLPKLRTLKVITMDNAIDWSTGDRGPSSKKLLYHWTSSDAHRPTLIDSPESYVETCCRRLGSSSRDSEKSGSDFDDSRIHSDDGNDSEDQEGDDGNDGDDDDGSGDESDGDAGNGCHENTRNGDGEIAETQL